MKRKLKGAGHLTTFMNSSKKNVIVSLPSRPSWPMFVQVVEHDIRGKLDQHIIKDICTFPTPIKGGAGAGIACYLQNHTTTQLTRTVTVKEMRWYILSLHGE